jgi:hypothetical protein
LYLAFTELVVRPVLAVRGPTDTVEANQHLAADVATDITSIVGSAMEATEPGPPITAHRIVDATSRSWDRLVSGNWGLWDGPGR